MNQEHDENAVPSKAANIAMAFCTFLMLLLFIVIAWGAFIHYRGKWQSNVAIIVTVWFAVESVKLVYRLFKRNQ